MVRENHASVLRHPSLLVDALLVLMILFGLWLMSGWLAAPQEPAGTFSMQLISDGVSPAVESTATPRQDALNVEQHSHLTLR